VILDSLGQAYRYAGLRAGFARAFAYLIATDLRSLTPGRHPIDGERLFVLIDRQDGRGREGARLEAHHRYIDIQLTIDGDEEIGWRAIAGCKQPAGAFDAEKDIGYFDDRPDTWLSVPSGHFTIFFPDDAHAPLGGRGPIRKAVVKVAM
jgi:YhcH/YjgK/YiaL family protein